MGFTSDPEIRGYRLAVLKDDLSYFPEYMETPVVRTEALEHIGGLRETLYAFADLGIKSEDISALAQDYNEEPNALSGSVRKMLNSKRRA